jgi:hypothetical protein
MSETPIDLDSRAHRQEGDRVSSEPTGQQVSDDQDRKSCNHPRRAQRPCEIGQIGSAGDPRRNGGQTRDGHCHQHSAQAPLVEHWIHSMA